MSNARSANSQTTAPNTGHDLVRSSQPPNDARDTWPMEQAPAIAIDE